MKLIVDLIAIKPYVLMRNKPIIAGAVEIVFTHYDKLRRHDLIALPIKLDNASVDHVL